MATDLSALKAPDGHRFEKEGERNLPGLEGRQQGKESEDGLARRGRPTAVALGRQHPDASAAQGHAAPQRGAPSLSSFCTCLGLAQTPPGLGPTSSARPPCMHICLGVTPFSQHLACACVMGWRAAANLAFMLVHDADIRACTGAAAVNVGCAARRYSAAQGICPLPGPLHLRPLLLSPAAGEYPSNSQGECAK